jgi:hypothetical protein
MCIEPLQLVIIKHKYYSPLVAVQIQKYVRVQGAIDVTTQRQSQASSRRQ